MRTLLTTLSIAALLALANRAAAAPIVSVDVDVLTPGIQSSFDVDVGESFLVDVVIEGVEAGASLNAFSIDLGFDSALVSATGVADGGFLLAPVFVLLQDLTAPEVNFQEVTLGPVGAVGSGTLARVSFEANSAGTLALDLNDVTLSQPFGVAISDFSVNDGGIRVMPAATAVPEPGTEILLMLGVLGLAGRKYRRVDFRRP
jgi:hypothetical protein